MTLRNLPRKRVSRPLSAALLAGNMALGACATLEPPAASPAPEAAPAVTPQAPPPARHAGNEIERAAREGISVLAPAQPLPVAPVARPESRELDLDPMPCQLTPAEGLTDSSLRPVASLPDAAQRPPGPDATGTLDGPVDAGPEAAPLPIQCANLFPDVAPAPRQEYAFGLETRDPVPHGSVMVVTGMAQPPNPWFSSVAAQQGFSYGGGRWVYQASAGPTVALGNLTANAPIWGSAVPIGGLQIADWAGGTQHVPQGRLAYSSTVGVLNYTDMAARSGAIDYGVTAGSGTVRYGLTPELTLESQMQSAPDLSTRGLGSTYSAGDLGTFQAGATQSSFDDINAWRYRFGYNVNLFESVSLAVTNEQIGAGFGDLAQYRNGVAAAPQMRNTLAAGVPIMGWGTLTGTYSGLRQSGEPIEQRFGLQHSMLIAPSVRLAVGADRDVVTGHYEMRAGVTMPVDAFMRGRWLPW